MVTTTNANAYNSNKGNAYDHKTLSKQISTTSIESTQMNDNNSMYDQANINVSDLSYSINNYPSNMNINNVLSTNQIDDSFDLNLNVNNSSFSMQQQLNFHVLQQQLQVSIYIFVLLF